MDSIADKCPKCECPIWNSSGYSTADGHSAWKDTDGRWYNGPAVSETTRACAHCGWAQKIVRKRGKLESVVSDET
jgi:hypothetical protein